jgi:PEP-CTERM motif
VEASLRLIAGGSITCFNQSMTSGVPEPSTWAMLGVGFAVMAFVGFKRRKGERLATI